MRLDPATPAASIEAPAGEHAAWTPPVWLTAGLMAGFVIGLLALAFLPGATLIERLRALDGGICAQVPSHSFFPAGQQLPLCSRNTGIYAGFSATFLMLLGSGRMRAARLPNRWVAVALGLAVLLMAEDGFNSLFLDLGLPHLYQPFNLLRLATGLGAGVAMAAFIVPVANSLFWRAEDGRASFASLGQLSLMLPVLSVAFVAISTQAAFMLYPIALFSTAGLLLALSLVNVVFVLGLTGYIGRITRWRQGLPFFSVAFIAAVLELMALFLLKTSVMNVLAR